MSDLGDYMDACEAGDYARAKAIVREVQEQTLAYIEDVIKRCEEDPLLEDKEQ